MKPAAMVVRSEEQSLKEQLDDRTEECEVLRGKLEEAKNKLQTASAKKRGSTCSILGLWTSTLALVGGIAYAAEQSILISTFIANSILGITFFTVLLILSLKK